MCPGESEHRRMVAEPLHVRGAAAGAGRGAGGGGAQPREGIGVSAESAAPEPPPPSQPHCLLLLLLLCIILLHFATLILLQCVLKRAHSRCFCKPSLRTGKREKGRQGLWWRQEESKIQCFMALHASSFQLC